MAVTSGYATVAQSQSIKEDSNDIWEPKKWGLISSSATSFNIPSTKTKDPTGCIPFVLKNTRDKSESSKEDKCCYER